MRISGSGRRLGGVSWTCLGGVSARPRTRVAGPGCAVAGGGGPGVCECLPMEVIVWLGLNERFCLLMCTVHVCCMIQNVHMYAREGVVL
jgi:hypothetical protein